jgi:hypothetical protein
VIEADRRPRLQHGLRLNLTAKPYLAGHNENAASQRGAATVATYRFASRGGARSIGGVDEVDASLPMPGCRLLPGNNRLGMFAKEN